jgi:uncharacterized membrane protein YgcG
VPNPLEILVRSSRRIAQVAAARILAYAILPALVALALAALLPAIGAVTWGRWGYVLGPQVAGILITVLIGVASLTVVAAGMLAVREYLRARDFVGAAEKVDEAVGGHQQILTLATLADPSASEKGKPQRSPLFPILWQRAARFLESFDPKRAFPLALGRSITRSSVLASGIALAMIAATFGLVRPPSPLEAEAAKLREIAASIEKSSANPDDIALASSVRDAADALENPQLPPEQKKQKLEEVMRQMASHSEERQGGGKEKGKGSGGGSSGKSGKGSGAGEGQGGNSKGSGGGTAQNQPGHGSGQNGKGEKGKGNSIELQNELAKAEAQVESEGAKSSKNNPQPGGDQNKGESPQPGKSASAKTPGNLPNPKAPGNIPQQSAQGTKNLPQAGGKEASGKDQGSNLGDTHMGEFPTPAKTQRFLKPGEKGEALNIHDARYVMFRLPSAIPVGSGGISVLDPNRTKATTPYVNAPLKETSNDAPPDERQLVPPRYRDLIH